MCVWPCSAAVRRSLCAVGEVQQVGHSNKWMVERLNGRDPFICVDGQHLGEQVDELSPVCLLRQHVTALQLCAHVHLHVRRTKNRV